MNKMKSSIPLKSTLIIALLSLFILILFVFQSCPPSATVTFFTDSEEITFYCSIADTDRLRRQGLNEATSLGEHEGMLFLYDDEQHRMFTMKDMQISLDIIFINSSLSVISIVEADVGMQHIPSNGLAQYVVEINQGSAEKYHIQQGTKVTIQYDV